MKSVYFNLKPNVCSQLKRKQLLVLQTHCPCKLFPEQSSCTNGWSLAPPTVPEAGFYLSLYTAPLTQENRLLSRSSSEEQVGDNGDQWAMPCAAAAPWWPALRHAQGAVHTAQEVEGGGVSLTDGKQEWAVKGHLQGLGSGRLLGGLSGLLPLGGFEFK